MGFITATPPKNAQYLDAYNALVYSCQMHGIGNALAIKNEGGSITQVDLQGIRNAIWNEARAIYFDASKLDLSLEEPFEKEDAKIEINAGKGFLVMPGKYTSTGKSVYSTGAFGGQQVPVLWEHFTDLANILNSLSSKKADYYAKIEVDKQKAKVDIFVTRGESITNSHGERNYNSDTKKNTEEWTISYTSTTPHDYDTGNTFEFYYHLTSCTGTENRAWQRLSGFTQTDILKLDVNKIIPTIKANTPEADEWIGYCHLQPVCHINYQVTLFNPSVYEDEIENGVAQEGCGNCCNLIANKYNYLKDSIKQFSGRVDFPLAISSDPLQIGHFMATFRYAGSLYGQYNCDTCIEDEFSADSMSDEEGGIASWHFCFLRRPTGALVAFHWQDTETDGIPLNGFGYRLEKKNGGYRLRFPNGYRHVFHGTILHSCQYENGSEKLETVIPGSYVQRSGEGTNFTFSSPVTGQVQLVVNSRSVPVNQYNNVDLPALKRHQLEEDEIPQTANELIREVRTSEDLSDAAGFNFTDFFQTGESPEFGEGEKCRVMEFYNPQNQLLGKYIEMTFDSGILAKGFWNREENELCPVELSMFEQMQQATNINQNLEKQTHIKYSSNGRNQAVTWRLKEKFLFGEQVIADYRNYENEEERQTAVYEYGTTAGSGSYGKLVFTRDFNGTWTRYEYDSYGRQSKIISPFGDAEENATESFCRVVTYDYTPLNENEDIFPQDTRPRTIITKVLGVEISREYHLYFENETWDIKAHAAGALYNAPGNQVTKNYSYATGDFIGRHWKTENYNGTSSVTTYEKINITTDDSGTESYDLKTTTESGFLPESGTREITVQDPAGHIVSREAYDVASNLQISGSTYTYDQFGRVLTETTVDGDVTETEYNCCGPRFMTAPDGTVTEYAYDVFNRVRFESVAGVTTYHTYDANDNEIQTVTEGKEGEEFTSSKIYSDDGLLLNETDAAGAVTSYAYGIGFEIVTDALGGIQRTDYYVDGQLKAISGTAALGKSYEYSVENGELCTKEIASEMEWSKVYTNFLGQTYKTVYPDQFVQTTVYDSLGYVKAIENSLGQKILQIYDDESGNLKYSVVKRGGTSDAIDWNNDSVTEYWSGYQLQDTMVVNRSSTYQYHDNVRVEISRNESSRDGKQTWNMQNGQTTHFERIFESEGEILEVTTNFDGRTVTNRFLEGILQESIDSVLGTTTYAYDEFNRQIGNDHTENGNPISLRLTLDAVGRTLSSTQVSGESSRTTTYVYDSLGRKTAETTPEGITTNYGYTTRGELASITGSAYKQSYTYDLQGRMATLTTWRNDDAPQVTAFEYNCRGWLFRKVYPDNTFETYAYRGDGKIALKTNVRNQVLEYSYNQAGELTALTSGDSVNRSFEYNLNGYLTKVTDTDGIRTFTVDVYGRILSETSATPEGISVARSFDSLQRLAKLSLNEIETEFTYDADGRLASISYGNATLNYAYADGTSLVANRTWKIGEDTPFLTLANTYDGYSRLQGIALNNRQEIIDLAINITCIF